jgi:hypothetical protein
MYVMIFFLTTLRKGIVFEQAADASWKATYVLLPIVSAFGTYWFGGQQSSTPAKPPADDAILDGAKTVALFSITAAVNLIVLMYFLFGVVFYDFNDPDSTVSYSDRVDMGIRIMVLLAGLVALPVGFLVGREVPQTTGPVPPIHEQAARAQQLEPPGNGGQTGGGPV